jgi:hypothetical protein
MDEPFRNEEEMLRFIADDYAAKVMSVTYGNALSTLQISKDCKIPIAVSKMERTSSCLIT